MASNADAKDKPATWNGFGQGDIAVRNGRLCTIQKIHWSDHPPTVTVKMHDDGNEVGTEFSRLQPPTDEDMLKLPLQSTQSRKRSFFDAFFAERRQRFESGKDTTTTTTTKAAEQQDCPQMPDVDLTHDDDEHDNCDNLDKLTFEDLMSDNHNHNHNHNADDVESSGLYSHLSDLYDRAPPRKRVKRVHHPHASSSSIESAQGWYCSACTVENDNLEAQKCYLCETPRTLEERVKYPQTGQNDTEPSTTHDSSSTKECADSVVVSSNSSNAKNDEQKQAPAQSDSAQLTVITWNVWFNQEVRVIERMHAIGAAIEAHNADIVCLQEVTPLILEILQSGAWYRNYSSTILPTHGFFQGLKYFNVVLTNCKHEFMRDAIHFKPFPNTQMGRHLVVAPIKLKDKGARSGTVVYAATSHLESPVGTYQGGQKDKFSAERKQQMQQALSVLDDRQICANDNVIFGGDMNWCRPTKNADNDGDLKTYLNKNWIDCYSELHPNEKGYTYDAKCNGMLLGYLQNRLDRMLLKQSGDLRLNRIEMIGREAIPNLRYAKVTRRQKGDETLMLPVLPSDHYGLCATFDIK